jgi:hypothetical protein
VIFFFKTCRHHTGAAQHVRAQAVHLLMDKLLEAAAPAVGPLTAARQAWLLGCLPGCLAPGNGDVQVMLPCSLDMLLCVASTV